MGKRKTIEGTLPEDLPECIDRLCLQIDAHFYTGDQLQNRRALKRMEWYLRRWLYGAVPYTLEIIEEREREDEDGL